MILWSWFYYDTGGAGQFAYDWQRSNRNSDWSVLIGNAGAASLLDIALVASRLHMCYRDIYWERDLGHAFEPHEKVLANLVAAASPADWSHLNELFMALNHCNSALAARIVCQWAPERAAACSWRQQTLLITLVSNLYLMASFDTVPIGSVPSQKTYPGANRYSA